MPTEKELIREIIEHSKLLMQAVAESEYWYKRFIDDLNNKQKEKNEEIENHYQQSMEEATLTYTEKLNSIKKDVSELEQQYGLNELNWDSPLWQNYQPLTKMVVPRVTRIGNLTTHGRSGSIEIPALLPILGTSNVLIKASGKGKETARNLLQNIMLRLLGTLPPGKIRFVCIDPVGLGSTMAGFIKDLPDILTGGQAWFDQNHIDQKLTELESHMAFVKQKYLGNSYVNMEDFNTHAGQIEEPYRLLIVSDFPARFSDTAAQRLISIATNGPSTGVYVLAMIDTDQEKLPYNFNISDFERAASIITINDNRAVWQDPDFHNSNLVFDNLPSSQQFNNIVKSIGSLAITASEVRVSYRSLATSYEKMWGGDSRFGIKIPIGQFGARETQYFILDEKLLSSALIIGKTGSGKSTLLHTIINGLASNYSPDEIEMYLLDLKEVEFKDYADFHLPHARVVAINCEREFGLSVLRGLDTEMRHRMDAFRSKGLTSLSEFRIKTDEKLPRVILLVDEFQELFNADDNFSNEASLLIDRLIRQGRAFGINVLLASQTLAGPYSFSAATRNQIPVRIALQCSDADSRLILSDDNDKASMLERPGEAIYNSANGRIEGNNRFQIAWLGDDDRESQIMQVNDFAKKNEYHPSQEQFIFEGNSLSQLENNQELVSLLNKSEWPKDQKGFNVWIGQPLEMKKQTAIRFRRQSRSNLLIVGQNEYEQTVMGIIGASIQSLAAQCNPKTVSFDVINLCDVDADWYETPKLIADVIPQKISIARRRDIDKSINEIYDEVNRRLSIDSTEVFPSRFAIIFGIQRARELRHDENFSSMSTWNTSNEDALQKPEISLREKLSLICREGPDLGVHVIVWCDTFTNLTRIFDRSEIGEFDMRIVLQMSEDDSRSLIDSEAASKLGPNRAIYFDEEHTGRLEKFRPYNLPSSDWLKFIMDKLKNRDSSL